MNSWIFRQFHELLCQEAEYYCHVFVRSDSLAGVCFSGTVLEPTEYCTQSGNGRFLAYIPSWWKNKPRLVRVVGGARPPPFIIVTITYRTKLQCTLQLSGQIHSHHFISTPMYSVLEPINFVRPSHFAVLLSNFLFFKNNCQNPQQNEMKNWKCIRYFCSNCEVQVTGRFWP